MNKNLGISEDLLGFPTPELRPPTAPIPSSIFLPWQTLPTLEEKRRNDFFPVGKLLWPYLRFGGLFVTLALPNKEIRREE